ncbi:MAG: tetratricopeptide (TPR) repeat protein [Flammeovirgaceae bacterium]|jgi:tetratricopeptide (TPR) repeat protein
MIENYFEYSDEGVSFSGDILEVVPNRTMEYYPNIDEELAIFEWYLPEFAHAAGALNLTLNQFINWSQKFNNDEFINDNTKAKMWTQFPYLNDNTGRGYGWEINEINNQKSYGHDGGGISHLQIIPTQDLTVIFLTNGYRNKYISYNISSTLAGIVNKELIDYSILAYQELDVCFNKHDIEHAKNIIQKLKKDSSYSKINLNDIINNLGYHRLYYYEFPRFKDAIEVFKFNTELSPTSSNAFDSLGEAYFEDNQLQLSLENYQKSLQLDSNNQNARAKIEEIQKLLKTK